ncbi:hypothetical protein KUCAC02_032306 [Chaenocephalus aceratus]|nr:hypothetical protein KUCAC02_032400 [Chaenocephalus aceratus]KAI4794064.1 hypothetical protein KUCAC02_032306 [Chaenocephalus aceratus]
MYLTRAETLLLFAPRGIAPREVKAKPGDDVTLHCKSPTDAGQGNYGALVYRDVRLFGAFPFYGPVELKVDNTGNYTCLVRTI